MQCANRVVSSLTLGTRCYRCWRVRKTSPWTQGWSISNDHSLQRFSSSAQMSDHKPPPPTHGLESNVVEKTIEYEKVVAPSMNSNDITQTEILTVSKEELSSTKGIKRKKKKQKKVASKVTVTQTTSIMPPPEPKRQERERDAIKVPTAESGGVPDPTMDYMAQAAGPPSTLPQPRRILVVLDLNGTLLHRPSKRRPFNFVARPHAQKFMRYCLDTFYLAIWSSARPQNVHKMVEKLLTPEDVARCVVIWSREHFGLSAEDYDSRVQVYKRLTRLWADPAVIASHPEATRGGCWDQSNTILVDDSIEKGRSEPHNLLAIPEFSGMANESAEVLPQVHDYLNTLCWQSDMKRAGAQSVHGFFATSSPSEDIVRRFHGTITTTISYVIDEVLYYKDDI